jgi:rSAM/selenodomain-associated transferase 1
VTPRRLIVFAKLPQSGRVKTRLAATVGPDRALRVYRRLLAATLRLAIRSPVERREWRFDAAPGVLPASSATLLRRLANRGWIIAPQQGHDLGERMAQAIESGLNDGDSVVLIGADCPVFDTGDIRAAFEALKTTDAVFAPAEDGGYVLVGLSRALPALFEAMPWGSDQVMTRSLERLESSGASVLLLRRMWDIDVQADLERYEAGLAAPQTQIEREVRVSDTRSSISAGNAVS